MNTSLVITSFAFALVTLTACDKKSPSAPPTPSVSTPSIPAAEQAAPAVTPQTGNEAAANPGSGPAEAGTAIGGVAGNQEKDGAKSGGAPAATGGDGTAPR